MIASASGESYRKHVFRGGGGHGRWRWARRSGGENLRGGVAGGPFYSRPPALVRRYGTPSATPDRGKQPARRAARQRARRECRRGTGRCRPRGASARAVLGAPGPREGASLGKVHVGARAVGTACTTRRRGAGARGPGDVAAQRRLARTC
jgi:hypothetical protein